MSRKSSNQIVRQSTQVEPFYDDIGESNTDTPEETTPRRQSLWKSLGSVFRRKKRVEKTSQEEKFVASSSDAVSADPTYEFADYQSSESDFLSQSEIRTKQATYDNSKVLNDSFRTGYYDNLDSAGETSSRIYDFADNVSAREPQYDLAANVLPPATPIYDFASNNEKIAKWLAGNLEDPRSMRFQTILSSLNKSQRERFKQIIGTLLATNLNLGIDVNVNFDLIDNVLHNTLIYQTVVKLEEKIRPRLARIDRLKEDEAIELLTQAAAYYFVLEDFKSLNQVNTKLNELVENQQSLSSHKSSRHSSQALSSRSRVSRQEPKPAIQEQKEINEKDKVKAVNIKEIVSTLFQVYSKGELAVDSNNLLTAKTWLNENGAKKSLIETALAIEEITHLFSRNMRYNSAGVVEFIGDVDDNRLLNAVIKISTSNSIVESKSPATIMKYPDDYALSYTFARSDKTLNIDKAFLKTDYELQKRTKLPEAKYYEISKENFKAIKYDGQVRDRFNFLDYARFARLKLKGEFFDPQFAQPKNATFVKCYLDLDLTRMWESTLSSMTFQDCEFGENFRVPEGFKFRGSQFRTAKKDEVSGRNIVDFLPPENLPFNVPLQVKVMTNGDLEKPSPANFDNPSISREYSDDQILEVAVTLFLIYKYGDEMLKDSRGNDNIKKTKFWLEEKGIKKPLNELATLIGEISDLFTKDIYIDSDGSLKIDADKEKVFNCLMQIKDQVLISSRTVKPDSTQRFSDKSRSVKPVPAPITTNLGQTFSTDYDEHETFIQPSQDTYAAAPKKYTGPLTQAKSIARKADSNGARTVKVLEGYELDGNNVIFKYAILSNMAAKVLVDERVAVDGNLIKIVNLADGSRRAVVDQEVLRDASEKLRREDLTKVATHDFITRALTLNALIKEHPDKGKPIRDTFLSRPSTSSFRMNSPYNPSASSASASAAAHPASAYQKPSSGPESRLGGIPFPQPTEYSQVRPTIHVQTSNAKAVSSRGVRIKEVAKTLFEVYSKGEDSVDPMKIRRAKDWLKENGVKKPLNELASSIQASSRLFTREISYDSYGNVSVGADDQRLLDCVMQGNKPSSIVQQQAVTKTDKSKTGKVKNLPGEILHNLY